MRLYKALIPIVSLLLSSCAGGGSYSPTYTKTTSGKTVSEGDEIVSIAKRYLGTKYKYGGIDKKGMDCSGLIYAVYQEKGKSLPRVSSEQAKQGKAVYIGELKAGDLIFFGARAGSKKITHAGIVSYSDGKVVKIIHSSSSRGVIEVDISNYWRDKYIKARRVL